MRPRSAAYARSFSAVRASPATAAPSSIVSTLFDDQGQIDERGNQDPSYYVVAHELCHANFGNDELMADSCAAEHGASLETSPYQ